MADENKQVYQSVIASPALKAGLGVPPLKMVLVHAQNEAQNAAALLADKSKERFDKERAVRKIIEHLESADG